MKKVLLSVLSMALVAAISIGGTLAYLQDSDSDVNVMTLGNVYIEQYEYERVLDGNGNVTGMQEFRQNKPLYPAVITGSANANNAWQPNSAVDLMYGDHIVGLPGGNGTWQNLNNVQDKFVFVENTGDSDAYFRTIILLEADETNTKNSVTGQAMIHLNVNTAWFDWPYDHDITDSTMKVTVNGETYYVLYAVYKHILPPDEICRPSLLQIGMDQEATNEIVEQFGDTYDVLVLSQAVQAAGFANAQTALDTAFGNVNATNVAEWFAAIAP